jgi:hypothetical protein
VRRALPWLLGAVLVVVAGAIVTVTPSDDDVTAPFSVRGAPGDAVQSRTIVATVTDAAFADEIEDPGGWSAEGNWLLVTVAASAHGTEVDATIQLATLAVDGRVFLASERPGASLRGTALRVGIDTVGVLAFELPPDVTTGTAELRLTTSYLTAELDDLVVVPLVLDGLDRTPHADIPRSEAGAP